MARVQRASYQKELDSYDANFKLIVIHHAENTNNCDASRKFGVSEANVRKWKSAKHKIGKAKSTRMSYSGPKVGRFQSVEEEVVKFVRTQRQNGMPVSMGDMTLKAHEVARGLKISIQEFKASRGWCARLMQRNKFSLRRQTSLCQKLPEDYSEKLIAYQKYVIGLRQSNNYLWSQIGNADETLVFFDMPSNYTVNDKGAKSILIKTTGNENMRVTVMLAVLADGTKLPPYVILKRKNMPKEHLPSGVIVRCQEKGWMTEELMKDWLHVVWNRRPGALLKQRAMLSLDAFKGHLTPKVKKTMSEMNTDFIVIPGGMTSQLQVLDVVNKCFKHNLKDLYSNWLQSGTHNLTPKGNLKKVKILKLHYSVSGLRHHGNKLIQTVKGFKKCCLSNALDGSEDDILWESDIHGESGEVVSDENSDGW